MNLTVAAGVPATPTLERNPVSADCWAYDERDRPIGCLVLWTENGDLSDLEVGWVTDDPPTALPDPSRIRCERRR